MAQASLGMADSSSFGRRDIDDALSIHSYDTVLPSYSEATVPSYTPSPASTSSSRPPPSTSSTFTPSRQSMTRPLPVPQPQIMSISQSNLPLRFQSHGPTKSNSWNPKIVYPTSSQARRKKPPADLNIFFRSSRPPVEALAHGDRLTQPIPSVAAMARRASSAPRKYNGRTFEEEMRMRELNELLRTVSRRNIGPDGTGPRQIPQIAGSLRRESTLLGEEWDNLAVEAQREEIVIRISELEAQFQDVQVVGGSDLTSAKETLAVQVSSLQKMLAERREEITRIISLQIQRLKELKEAGTKVSHLQKDQIKNDMLAMKAEIAFLDQRAEDLDKFATKVERLTGLEDDSKNWDHYFAITTAE